MTATPELLPCPLCDSRAIYMTFGAIFYGVECSNETKCGLRLNSMVRSYSEAADIWNRRAPTPDTRLRELAQELELWLRVVEFTHDRHDRMAADFSQRLGAALAEKEGEK